MKTTIYHFSGTGNSLQLAKLLGEKIGNTAILSMAETGDIPTPSPGDGIGLVFPVYMWGIPKLVRDFLSRFPESPGTYFFTVANCGSSVGRSIIQIRRLLKKNGNRLSAAFKIIMPGNYIPLYGAKKESVQKKLFFRAGIKLDRIAGIIKQSKKARLFPHPLTCLLSLPIYGASMKRINRLDEEFKVDKTCNACGICRKICPVDNIRMENKHPVWQHHCEHCMACLQWCPQEAIQFGAKTRGRTRYRNPSISLEEMLHR